MIKLIIKQPCLEKYMQNLNNKKNNSFCIEISNYKDKKQPVRLLYCS